MDSQHFYYPNEQGARQRPLKPGNYANKQGARRRPLKPGRHDWLYLRIRTEHIGVYPSPPMSGFAASADMGVAEAYVATRRDPNTTPNPVTYLLQGTLEDFLRFSCSENAQWLLTIAHDLCDPAARRGSLWIMNDQYQTMEYVQPTSPLRAAIYEYRVVESTTTVVLRITKRVPSHIRSFSRSIGYGRAMRNSILGRDGSTCWITQTDGPVNNSHICPLRVGDAQARYIYQIFNNMADPPATIYSPQFGILLNSSINHWFDQHFIGFRWIGNNQYQIHNFYNPEVTMPYGNGQWPRDREMEPPFINGWVITPPNPTSPDNPPPGLFRWHYLQCVLKRFRAAGYDRIAHIAM
ncbi:hypothetical protein F5878DRAFT_565990 [Lentinula raphanica]|uniref:HNH nuclease domain-containing protein n=1 Tax=Lentinula raphanica TaxID=153919 RepID=A0AA38P522_9AGAR|nr:hypothetical protein F5878DRAFT_565990 [Lentinula raphanica]